MWYSDHWLLGLPGTSRFDRAKHFLTTIFEEEKKWLKHKVSLVTFDTHAEIKIPFTTVTDAHKARLQILEPVGSETALFDAIDFCLNEFDNLNKIYGIHPKCLYILTDGRNNFGAETTAGIDVTTLKDRTNQLQIAGYVIHVGNKDMSETKKICDQLGYKYINLHGNSVNETARSLMDSVSRQLKSIMAIPRVVSTDPAFEKALEMWRNMENQIKEIPDAHNGELASATPQSKHAHQPAQPLRNTLTVKNPIYLDERNILTQ